jgi:ABC-2 type transport system permease protein
LPLSREALQTIFLIARREFVTRVRSRFYIVGTIVFMAALAGYIVLQAYVIGRMTTTVKVGFDSSAQVLAKPLQTAGNAAKLNVQVQEIATVSEGQDKVRSGALDAFVSGNPAGPDVAVKDQLNTTIEATLTALVKEQALNRALASSGANPAQVEAQVAAASIHTVYLDPNATIKAERQVVGIFVAVLLYVALVIYGQLVASGVVEEKSNRVIEILLATVRPRQLLIGKVLGIGAVGLLQLVLLSIVALITVSRTQVISVPDVGVVSVAAGIFWFIVGFLFYALIYAAAGSLVSRQEDIGSVTGPLSMLIVGTYLAFFWVVANPDNPIGIGLSMLPPFAPILMPARIATGDAQLWQVVVAAVLTIAAIAGLNALAARIYSNSVLRIGTRVPLMQAWRGRA